MKISVIFDIKIKSNQMERDEIKKNNLKKNPKRRKTNKKKKIIIERQINKRITLIFD